MIWIWSIPDTWPNKRMGECLEDTGTDRFLFQDCKFFKSDEAVCPKVVFECQEKFLFDVLPNSGFLIIVSNRVLNILNNICPNDFQVFEANVYVEDKKVEGYHLINILNAAQVIDREKSIYSIIRGTNDILGFDKIVYKYENLIEHDLVRNADYRSHILASDRLKGAFAKAKVKGVQFNGNE